MGLKLNTASSGSVTLEPANTASNYTLTVPAQTGTVVATDSSGNVGIGTSSPTEKLHVVGGLVSTGGSAATSGAAITMYYDTSNDYGVTSTLHNGVAWKPYVIRSNGMIFKTKGDVEAARLDTSGNLLVGTTSALTSNGERLDIVGAQTNGGAGVAYIYNSSSASADGSPPLVISKAMTTTSSSARFVQFYAGGVTTTAMGGIVGNGASNVQFASLSDAREKTNIQSISGSLEKINALNPVEFDWIADGSHVNAGFVAQEVEQVFPEFVVDNMANEGQEARKGLTGGMTGGIVAHLVKAIQELKAELDTVKTELATLKGQA